MNSKEIENKLASLELQIFNIKVNVNSGQYISNYEVQEMIKLRKNLKKEHYQLKKAFELRKERKEKLNKIYK